MNNETKSLLEAIKIMIENGAVSNTELVELLSKISMRLEVEKMYLDEADPGLAGVQTLRLEGARVHIELAIFKLTEIENEKL